MTFNIHKHCLIWCIADKKWQVKITAKKESSPAIALISLNLSNVQFMTFTTIILVNICKVVTVDIRNSRVVPQGYKCNKNLFTRHKMST